MQNIRVMTPKAESYHIFPDTGLTLIAELHNIPLPPAKRYVTVKAEL